MKVLRSLLLIFFLLAVAGCDGYTRLSGHIVDGDGNPISGATITVTRDGYPVGIKEISDADDVFDAGGTHAPSHDSLLFRVRKDGFTDDSRRVPPESVSNMRIVLERYRPAERDAK